MFLKSRGESSCYLDTVVWDFGLCSVLEVSLGVVPVVCVAACCQCVHASVNHCLFVYKAEVQPSAPHSPANTETWWWCRVMTVCLAESVLPLTQCWFISHWQCLTANCTLANNRQAVGDTQQQSATVHQCVSHLVAVQANVSRFSPGVVGSIRLVTQTLRNSFNCWTFNRLVNLFTRNCLRPSVGVKDNSNTSCSMCDLQKHELSGSYFTT